MKEQKQSVPNLGAEDMFTWSCRSFFFLIQRLKIVTQQHDSLTNSALVKQKTNTVICGLSHLCSHVHQQGELQEFAITLFEEVEQASYKNSDREES